MSTLATIDLAQLATVTGGACTCMQQPQQQPGGAAPQDAGQAPSPGPGAGAGGGGGGGGFLQGLQAFLGFLQSPMFGNLVGGASQILSAFSSPSDGGASPQAGATQQA